MNSTIIAALVFACLFGAGLFGVRVRAALPEDHLSSETKDAVKVGMGLVATMAALVLGLLVASTKGSYDAQKNEVTQMAAKTVFLDRVLANYGSESAESRDLLRRSVASAINHMWPDKKSSQAAQLDPSASSGEGVFNSIEKLSPQNDVQSSLKSQAAQIATDVGQMRWLLFEQTETSISVAMLIVFDLLAGDHFHECRPVRAPECHGRYCADAGRAVSSRSDLLNPGTGHAIRRGDSDFPEAHVQCLSSSRALTRRATIRE
jgi:fluoride ion exporter CrcB/FEX